MLHPRQLSCSILALDDGGDSISLACRSLLDVLLEVMGAENAAMNDMGFGDVM